MVRISNLIESNRLSVLRRVARGRLSAFTFKCKSTINWSGDSPTDLTCFLFFTWTLYLDAPDSDVGPPHAHESRHRRSSKVSRPAQSLRSSAKASITFVPKAKYALVAILISIPVHQMSIADGKVSAKAGQLVANQFYKPLFLIKLDSIQIVLDRLWPKAISVIWQRQITKNPTFWAENWVKRQIQCFCFEVLDGDIRSCLLVDTIVRKDCEMRFRQNFLTTSGQSTCKPVVHTIMNEWVESLAANNRIRW